ncbi:mechanosensitive ion channel protein MscS [Segatella oulorum]|mgnify:FL=1|uniref:mechanosensitive ion channel protein MscS n=1 Tax=Segatella oulorum TaxID=28136 RepID=UPI0028E24B66|nr:mechanosensitive ion channel protein MscS [Segatella oulorum]
MMEQEYNTEKNKPEYAVKPHHRLKRLGEGGPSMLKVRNILNLVFMALAVVGVVLYLQSEQHIIATIILIVAVVIKFAEVAIRMFRS